MLTQNWVLVQFEAGGKADESAAAEATRWLSLCLTAHTFSDGRTDSYDSDITRRQLETARLWDNERLRGDRLFL